VFYAQNGFSMQPRTLSCQRAASVRLEAMLLLGVVDTDRINLEYSMHSFARQSQKGGKRHSLPR